MTPEPRKDPGYSPLILLTGSGPEAATGAALVGALVGISKIFETREVRTDMNGSCSYGEPESPMISPCVNVRVNLLDQKKNIVTTSTTNQYGDFRFYIPNGQSYLVQVIDRKGRTAYTTRQVGRSQMVSLFLKP